MFDSISPFSAIYFRKDLIKDYATRVENYFYFIEAREEYKNYPFFEFIQNLKKHGENFLKALFDNKVLIKEEKPSFYLYEQEFGIYEKKYKRKGLLASFNLSLSNFVFPHEDTFEWAVDVHKEFYERSKINFEPVLLLYKGEKIDNYIREIKETIFEFEDEYKEVHRINRVNLDNAFFEEILKTNFVIADGHHRFKAMQKAKFKKRLVLLFSIYDENLKILPTHRGCNLEKEKILNLIKKSKEIKKEEFENRIKNLSNPEILFFYENKFYYLKEGQNPLSVFNLHNEIIGNKKEGIGFYRNYIELVKEVKKNKFNIGFFLPPVTPHDVYEHAINKIRMPPKSTDFYPKPLCGFIGMLLENSI